MRFASILVDQLFTIVQEERHRVRRGFTFFLPNIADLLIQSNRLETQLHKLRGMKQEWREEKAWVFEIKETMS
jgi:hypothetical protein